MNKILFKDVYLTINDDDTLFSCDVCCERVSSPENEIVLCDYCNVAVHQFCYGYPLSVSVPKGFYFSMI